MYKTKIVKCLYIVCWTLIVTSFIFKIFGSNVYAVIDNKTFFLDDYIIIKNILFISSYLISNLLILMSMIKRKLTLKELIVTLLFYTSSYFLTAFFESKAVSYEMISTINTIRGILETLYCVLFGVIVSHSIRHTIKIIVLNLLYQILSLITKELGVEAALTSTFVQIVLMLDYYLLLIVTYLREKYNVQIFCKTIKQWWSNLTLVLSNKRSKSKRLQEVQESICEKQIDNIDKILLPIYLIGLAIFQFGTVLLIGKLLDGTIINMLYIIISFFISRKIFGESWHAETVLSCTSAAAISFTICDKLSVPLCYSILINGILGTMLAFALHKLYFYLNNDKRVLELEERVSELKEELSKFKEINLNSLTKEQMRETYKHLTSWEIDLLYDVVNKKGKTMKEIADKYNYSIMQIYRIVDKIKRSLK